MEGWRSGETREEAKGSEVTAENGQQTDVEAFLERVRAVPGPAQMSVDVARRLVSEPVEAVLASLVKAEFAKQDE